MKVRRRAGAIALMVLTFTALSPGADRRGMIYSLGLELEKQATGMALNSFEHFKGWNNAISDREQAVLFKSEAFAASSRLFLRLTEERSDYFLADFLRTNLYNAFMYLSQSFQELQSEMKRGGIMPYELSNCRKILDRMDREFSQWPLPDNLAYLHQKYVKTGDETVYMLERRAAGTYFRRPFRNLESLFRFNYDLKRGKDPWKYLADISEDALEKMEEGEPIDLTFEGRLIIEQGNRPNRSVYLIEQGRKRGLTSPQVLARLGGWGKVFEVPREVIDSYPDGEPIR
jgi:hypothetical protein